MGSSSSKLPIPPDSSDKGQQQAEENINTGHDDPTPSPEKEHNSHTPLEKKHDTPTRTLEKEHNPPAPLKNDENDSGERHNLPSEARQYEQEEYIIDLTQSPPRKGPCLHHECNQHHLLTDMTSKAAPLCQKQHKQMDNGSNSQRTLNQDDIIDLTQSPSRGGTFVRDQTLDTEDSNNTTPPKEDEVKQQPKSFPNKKRTQEQSEELVSFFERLIRGDALDGGSHQVLLSHEKKKDMMMMMNKEKAEFISNVESGKSNDAEIDSSRSEKAADGSDGECACARTCIQSLRCEERNHDHVPCENLDLALEPDTKMRHEKKLPDMQVQTQSSDVDDKSGTNLLAVERRSLQPLQQTQNQGQQEAQEMQEQNKSNELRPTLDGSNSPPVSRKWYKKYFFTADQKK